MAARKIMQGWRYFRCKHCGAHFKEACRDHAIPSNTSCINVACASNAFGGPDLVASAPDPSLPVDMSGNLIEYIPPVRLS